MRPTHRLYRLLEIERSPLGSILGPRIYPIGERSILCVSYGFESKDCILVLEIKTWGEQPYRGIFKFNC